MFLCIPTLNMYYMYVVIHNEDFHIAYLYYFNNIMYKIII